MLRDRFSLLPSAAGSHFQGCHLGGCILSHESPLQPSPPSLLALHPVLGKPHLRKHLFSRTWSPRSGSDGLQQTESLPASSEEVGSCSWMNVAFPWSQAARGGLHEATLFEHLASSLASHVATSTVKLRDPGREGQRKASSRGISGWRW